MTAASINKQVRLVCPVCRTKKILKLPESVLNQTGQLTTISIPNGLICDHHFQAFVDNQFKVRGYQKVDFEIKQKDNTTKKFIGKTKDLLDNSDREFYENLVLEGNYLKYIPKNKSNRNLDENKREISIMTKREMTLEEIYEEFWEFIDDDNYEFRELILKDEIRRKTLKCES